MPLNIKDENVHRQARELAQLMDSSLTEAVRVALADKLAAMRPHTPALTPQRRIERVRALAREIRADLGAEAGTSDHSDLYDDDGLPA